MNKTLVILLLVAAPHAAYAQHKSGRPIQSSAAAFRIDEARLRARWEKALVLLQKADDDSIAAINGSLADVGGSFDAAAKNARPFVVDLLDLHGKWRYAKAIPGKITGYGTSFVNYVFGSSYQSPLAPDDFEAYARTTFTAKVFDPEVFKRGVSGGVNSYVAKLKAIEARLFIDLKADVEDVVFRVPAIQTPELDKELLKQVDVGVEMSVAEAASDFGFTVAKEYVSYWGGNVVSGIVFASTAAGVKAADPTNDPFSATALLGTAIIGYGVSYALDKTVEAVGYDPTGRLADRIEAVLRLAQVAVVEGRDREKSSRFVWFILMRRVVGETREGDIYAKAADKLAATTYLGVRPTLTALHAERLCIRRRLVWEAVFGPGAAMPVASFMSPHQIEESKSVISKALETMASE